MNAYTNQYQQQQYQQNLINTATPEQILLMLYDGAIRFTRQAMMAAENGNQVQKLERISKALAIIVEFSNTLDHEIGGQIAADLDGLYQFMIRELNAARKDDTGEKLKTVEGLLVGLRETWGQAVTINREQQGAVDTVLKREQSDQPDRAYVPLHAAG
ncbi:MAG: flagellar export chaperone FliS [Deltaproteobacteria bacterium]|nr:flagellar export chaperone FliS [Deltaproteobacteria bacterium]